MRTLILFVAAGFFTSSSLLAQSTSTPEQRLREQLKQVITQLRSAETERTALQAEKAALEGKVKSLEKQAEEITKLMAADKDSAKEEADKLRAEIIAKESELSQTKDLLVKADTFGKQSAELARKTEAERSRLSSENIQLKRVVGDQRVKNAKMLEIASEILTRYSKFGLGTAITAREPFVGITRARLESLVEDYSGQLAGQRIRLDGTTQKPSSASEPTRTDNSKGKKKAGAKP